MWQPIGVFISSAIAYGTAAKWRCDPDYLSCRSPELEPGQPCCTVGSNMGWRYCVIVLGGMTLFVFFLRYFVFHFHESPKFLLSRGKEAEAIAVLHRIAKFNKAPPPVLTLDMFAQIDETDSQTTNSAIVNTDEPKSTAATTKNVLRGVGKEFRRLKSIFTNKLTAFIFVLLAIAYMVGYVFFAFDKDAF